MVKYQYNSIKIQKLDKHLNKSPVNLLKIQIKEARILGDLYIQNTII